MSSENVARAPRHPSQVRLETVEDATTAFKMGHATQLGQVHGKAALRRFVAPVQPQAGKRSGRAFTEADLDRFLASLDKKMFPAALASDKNAVAIGRELWAARSAAWEEVKRRLGGEKPTDDATLAAVERAIVRTLLIRDRACLLNFVGLLGVEPLELALALWSSHAHGWFALATDAQSLWPRITAWLASQGSRDGVERGGSNFLRFSGGPASAGASPRAAGMRPYQALLK